MAYDYDLLVIGAGSGGLAASKRAAKHGAKVAITEQARVGGTCVIRGCVPKKFMVYASRFPQLQNVSLSYGWRPPTSPTGNSSGWTLNWNTLRDNIQTEISRLNNLHITLLKKAGVTLIQEHTSFIDVHTVQAGQTKISAKYILIATGSHSVLPPIDGINHAVISDSMFELPIQPKHIVIIGGGYIGVEFAGIFCGLGTKVTQIIRRDLILRGFDVDVRKIVQTSMQNRGITLCTNTNVTRITKNDNLFTLTLDTGKTTEHIDADNVILCATGRTANTKNLSLENAGIITNEKNAITVNGFFQTNQKHIYALGDVIDRTMLTPVAIAEGRAFADNLFLHTAQGTQNQQGINYETIATAVFSYPEAASVGITEQTAIKKFGIDHIKIYHSQFNSMFYSLGKTRQSIFMKLIVENKTRKILGAHMVGEAAAEIIQSLAVAITMGATKEDLDKTMALHPSSAEEFVTMI